MIRRVMIFDRNDKDVLLTFQVEEQCRLDSVHLREEREMRSRSRHGDETNPFLLD